MIPHKKLKISPMIGINKTRNLILILTGIILIIIIWLTVDVITETSPRDFNVDFKNKNDIISGYGTLIGGILSFLSILFVILSLLEQRQQIIRNEKNKEKEDQAELLDKLKLLNSFLKSMQESIDEQGKEMKEYFIEEQAHPSKMNKMYFLINRNFARAVEMDSLSIYKGIRLYLKDESEWEKIFLNLYTLIDFYKEGFKELREKYDSQIKYKVDEQRKIAQSMGKLMNMCATLIDDYKIASPANYIDLPWAKLINDFTGVYYEYLEACEENNEPSDFRFISNDILLPLLKVAMDYRDDIGYDTMGSRNIVGFTADIRKQINEIEVHCKYYAKDIEEQYQKYFSPNNDSLIKLQKLKHKIENIFIN